MKGKSGLFAVGGTGGHFYPAIALAGRLKEKDCSLTIHFAGGGGKIPHFFDGHSFPYKKITASTLSFRRPFRSFMNLPLIGRGIKESIKIIDECVPKLVIGFGSFYSLPLL